MATLLTVDSHMSTQQYSRVSPFQAWNPQPEQGQLRVKPGFTQILDGRGYHILLISEGI